MSCDESYVGRLNFIVTCEHASFRLPAGFSTAGLPRYVLRSHWAYDIGASGVARRLAGRLDCRYFAGRYSRLVIDLNRSEAHPSLIPRRAGRLSIVANEGLTRSERQRRLERYWRPHRVAVEAALSRLCRAPGFCVHIAVHSFTPVLSGIRRSCEVGLLYDPGRCAERLLAARIRSALRNAGAEVRLNYPYRGTADGLTTAMRRRFGPSRYAGLEIEMNQSLFTATGRTEALAGALETALTTLPSPLRFAAGPPKTAGKPLRVSWERLRRRAISD